MFLESCVRSRGGRIGRFGAAVAVCGLSLGALAASAMPQPPAEKPKAKAGAQPVLLLERQSLAKMVVDPKDAALARAVEMIPARLRELPLEIPDLGQLPQPVVDLVLTILANPGRIGITYNADDQTGGGFGVGLVASLLAKDQQQAQNMHGTINALLAMGAQVEGEPSEKFAGMTETPMPVAGVLRYGPRKSGNDWRYEIHAGSAGDPDLTFASLPTAAPKGFDPVLRVRMDMSSLTPLFEQFKDMAGGDPQAERGFAAVEEAGYIGSNAVRYSYQFGYLPDRSLGLTVMEGAKKHAAAMGIGTVALGEADFKCIPADSYTAGIRKIDLSSMQKTLNELRESQSEVAEGLAKFQQATGVDLLNDVLGTLGGTFGWYMSDATGGFGLMSAVALMEIKDRAKFDAASDKLTSFANTALAVPTKGYFRARAWSEGDAKMVSLTFPGIPIPLEITYTTTDRFLVLAASPQAALAAARQAMGKGDGGLMTNTAFTGTLPKGKTFESVGFTDTPRVMVFGYQFVSMFGSAVANMVRSPRDAAREPGMVVPTLGELRKDARPKVSFGYWDGDNLVRESHGNRSLLVEGCGSAGSAAPFIPVIVAAVAASGFAAQQREIMGGGMRPRFGPPPPPDMDENEGEDEKPAAKRGSH